MSMICVVSKINVLRLWFINFGRILASCFYTKVLLKKEKTVYYLTPKYNVYLSASVSFVLNNIIFCSFLTFLIEMSM